MKTVGIIGGIGPPSTVKYYEGLTQGVQKALGGSATAKVILTSLNGEDIKQFRLAGDVAGEGAFYAAEALRLEQAGADFILIASNTSHKNVPYVESAITVPLLHLADATAQAVVVQGVEKVALLGTIPTMEQDFYKTRLAAQGLEVMMPDVDDRHFINDTIYTEMVKGIVRPEINAGFVRIINKLKDAGADGVILGCTELTLLDLADIDLPVFDTVKIHIEAALKEILSDDSL